MDAFDLLKSILTISGHSERIYNEYFGAYVFVNMDSYVCIVLEDMA